MNRKRYALRAAKYFVYLLGLFIVLYALLILTGYSSWETLGRVTASGSRLWLLLAAFVGLPLLYPLFGFVTRTVRADFDGSKEIILRTMALNGFKPVEEGDGRMVFRAATAAGKLRLLYEDRITLTRDDNYIVIEGPRKEVVKTEFRLKTFL